jgi:hypothetical protein
MSSSTKSKPASASSPATGGETETKSGKATSKSNDSSGRRDVIEIELEHSRQREIAWTIGGILGGLLLVAKLGTVGVWGGYAMIAYGLYKAYLLVMSFVNPPGTIVVTDRKVVLPRGVHRGKPLEVTPTQVTAVYFLRRSVPWNRSSPVLVIELGEKAMIFPRDWFATEADQRHIVHALLSQMRPAAPAAASE